MVGLHPRRLRWMRYTSVSFFIHIGRFGNPINLIFRLPCFGLVPGLFALQSNSYEFVLRGFEFLVQNDDSVGLDYGRLWVTRDMEKWRAYHNLIEIYVKSAIPVVIGIQYKAVTILLEKSCRLNSRIIMQVFNSIRYSCGKGRPCPPLPEYYYLTSINTSV